MVRKMGITDRLGRLAVHALAALLVACGGGGGGGSSACVNLDPARDPALPGCAAPATPTTPGGGTVAPATSAQLLVSSQQLDSSGLGKIDVTVIARDAAGLAVANRVVTLTVADPSNTALLSNFSKTTGATYTTDANGKLTATLSLGADRSNRAIVLSAKVDQANATNTVTVFGTNISIIGNTAVGFNTPTTLSVFVTDALGKAIANTAVTVTSSAGNTVALSSPVTDITGKTTITLTGTRSGTDTITARAAGALVNFITDVSSSAFNLTSAATATTPAIGSTVTATLRWATDGVPVVGQPVNFAVTRGTIISPPAVTNAAGEATVSFTSSSTGPSTLTGSSSTGARLFASISVTFVSLQPAASLDLQADKTTVGINPPGSTANEITLIAVARDKDNNPVSGATVAFRIDQDLTGASLTPASSTTDAFGVARSRFIPTASASSTNGVLVSAVVPATGVPSRQLALTVGGQRLFVRIGTDNSVGSVGPNYTKQYSAFVTDAAGNPVPNATVQFLIRPRQDIAFDPAFSTTAFFQRDTTPLPGAAGLLNDYAYAKGVRVFNGTFWVPVKSASCFNEDVQFDAIYTLPKDLNKNNVLDPGNVFSVNTDSATNSSGFAIATITYPKDRADWLAVSLKATAQVAGTEASASATFALPAASEDINKFDVTPPGVISPYGTANTCSDRN